MISVARALVALLLVAGPVRADNWPAWRGPNGDGHTAEITLPLEWSAEKNIRWKIALPGPGNSTPIIWRDRIFLTQATQLGQKRALHCFNRADGKELWKTEVFYNKKETTHGTNPYCSASPTTDGQRVYVSHGSAGLFCYDLDGKELWKKDLGKQEHIWGNASSPVLYRDMVLLWVGPGENQLLVALDKKTGEKRWEYKVEGGKSGAAGNSEWVGSWSTPLIARVGRRDELLLSVPEKMLGLDPKTGKLLWTCAGLTKLVYTSPVCSADGIVVAMSGFHGQALAVRAGGSGDVTESNRLWHHARQNPQRIGSPVIVGGHAYLINEQGMGQRFDLKTGEDDWKKERLSTKTWSSPVVSGDRLYLVCENGETVVLSAGPEPKVLARNRLDGETTRASVAVSDGELFIRTYKHLWCIGKK
jgi:outer membrane protein assembly factor BamB